MSTKEVKNRKEDLEKQISSLLNEFADYYGVELSVDITEEIGMLTPVHYSAHIKVII